MFLPFGIIVSGGKRRNFGLNSIKNSKFFHKIRIFKGEKSERQTLTTTVDLPKYPNAFIGRSYHLRALSILLQEDKTRLVNLLGPGGMGKTRLAIQVAAANHDKFVDGVCFVPLDKVFDAGQVPLYIGQRLGLKADFDSDWIGKITRHLLHKNLLLVLDNLEQIIDCAPYIAQILDQCPAVKVLSTSRETLNITHEIEYPLDSLNRPSPNLFPGPAELTRFDAIQLFVQRAQMSLPHFELHEKNAPAIVNICHELDGLPLPIELAAARIRLFSPELILNKLQDNSFFLKSKKKDTIPRHQTIRNTVSWSFDLLDEPEKEIFQQLSIFNGGISPEAIQAIAPHEDAEDVIESFLQKSLIVKDRELQGVPYFRMLKLIRDFGLEKLDTNPKRENYYRSFVNYFTNFVAEGMTKLRRESPGEWTAYFDVAYENLVITLEWLLEHQPEEASQFGALWWPYHLQRGLLREGLEIVERLLEKSSTDQETTRRLLEGAGVFSQNLGQYLAAKSYAQRCLDLSADLEDPHKMVKALNNLGWAEWRVGNYQQMTLHSRQALELAEELNDEPGKATALNNLAWASHYQGQFEEAEKLQRRVLHLHQSRNDKKGIAFAQANLSWAIMHLGKLTEAEQLIQEATRLFVDQKNEQLTAFARLIHANLLMVQNKMDTARQLLETACLPNFEKIGDIWGIGTSCLYLGQVALLDHEPLTAQKNLDRALKLFYDSNDKFGMASARLWLSKWCQLTDDAERATELLEQSLLAAKEMNAQALCAAISREKEEQLTKHQVTPMTTSAQDPFLRKVQQTLEAHLGDPNYGIKDLCQDVGISSSHLHRKLKELAGQSTTQFIRSIRLEKAKELLKDPEQPITAVAYDTGFKDPNYFFRVFKKAFAMTPKAFRDQHLED